MQYCDVSVVTPLHNEEKSIEEHFNQINKAMSESGRSFEVIFVNDGSTDASEEILAKLCNEHRNVVVINLYRKKGKAAALEAGIKFAKGKYIAIIDSDLQYYAGDIPEMVKELDKGYDVVSGKRVARQDSRGTKITSCIFNMVIRGITGLNFTDYFSGLKCFNRNVLDYLSLYGDLYRFASLYAFKQGFKVREIPIKHSPRAHGTSKYNPLKRFGLALLDTFTILMTVTFNQDRVYYIGLGGLLLLGMGTILLFGSVLFSGGEGVVVSGGLGRIGLILIFIAIQIIILKKVSRDYFDRHQKEYIKRRSNLKSVQEHKDN